MEAKKVTAIIAGSLLAAAVWLIPAPSRADGTVSQSIVEFCLELAEDPDAAPNCFGQCVSALHVCSNEQTGASDPTPACEKKLAKAVEACAL